MNHYERHALTIALAGDVMLGRLVNQAIARHGYEYPWGDVLPVVAQADLFLVNLECALTAETTRWHNGHAKAFYFRADPDRVATLVAGGVDVVALANNHAGDFGMRGLVESVHVLDAPFRQLCAEMRTSVTPVPDHPVHALRLQREASD